VDRRAYRPPVEEWATRTLARPDNETDHTEQVERVLPRDHWETDQADNMVEIPQPYYRRNSPPEESYEQPAYVRTIPESGDLRGHPWKGTVEHRRTMTATGDGALFEEPPLDYGYYAMQNEEDLDKEGVDKYPPRGRPDSDYIEWKRTPGGRKYLRDRKEGGPNFREYQKQQREWRRDNPSYDKKNNETRREKRASAFKVASEYLQLRRDYGSVDPHEEDVFDDNDNLDREAVKKYRPQRGDAARQYKRWKKKHYRKTLMKRRRSPYKQKQKSWRRSHKSRVKSYQQTSNRKQKSKRPSRTKRRSTPRRRRSKRAFDQGILELLSRHLNLEDM